MVQHLEQLVPSRYLTSFRSTSSNVTHNVVTMPAPSPDKTAHISPDLTLLVELGNSTNIDDREETLRETLSKAQTIHEPEARDAVNRAMIKLFHKPSVYARAKDTEKGLYFQWVPTPAAEPCMVSAETVFRELLAAEPDERKNHQKRVSSLAYAMMEILALTLHREHSSSRERNGTSPYFDLSPLYGTDDIETNKIRLKDGTGMLRPDCFVEDRLHHLPLSVPVLLVLWNRYHNYAARQLLVRYEGKKWLDPSLIRDKGQQLRLQDDTLFRIARSLTCIHFMNVIREDVLKALLGLPLVGPSVPLNLLSNPGSIDQHKLSRLGEGCHSTIESAALYSFASFSPAQYEPAFQTGDQPLNPDIGKRQIGSLSRNNRGYFEDSDLARVLFEAINLSSSNPGHKNVPDSKRAFDQYISKIEQARERRTCTLNEFRKQLGLKPLTSFLEWNSDAGIAKAAENIYGDINKLELLPGLLAERTGGFGFCFGYTMTWGLLADIITRIRCDPRFTTNFNPDYITRWGFDDCIPKTQNEAGSFHNQLPKLLQRSLPDNCPYDNVYCLFPFSVPLKSQSELERILGEGDAKKYYTFKVPRNGEVKVLRTYDAISEVFNDQENFASTYTRELLQLTGGYGHMLGFNDQKLHDRDLMLTLHSLFPDSGAAKRIATDFSQKARDNLRERFKISQGQGKAEIDVIMDIINATCIRWISETILDLDIDHREAAIEPTGRGEKHHDRERQQIDNLTACHAHVLQNFEPELGWALREKAVKEAQRLSERIKFGLSKYAEPIDIEDYSDFNLGRTAMRSTVRYGENLLSWLATFGEQIWMELSGGSKVSRYSAKLFLDRMVKAAKISPLPARVIKRVDHLRELTKEIEREIRKYRDENQPYLRQLLGLSTILSGPEAEKKAAQEVEERRVIANIFGLAAHIAAVYPKVCAQAVGFYLEEENKDARNELIKLCRDEKSSNEEIMAYIREAQRMKYILCLRRNVVGSKEVKQGPNDDDVTVLNPGDRIFADLSAAYNDPQKFPEPRKINLHRGNYSLQGLGMHKCPGEVLIEQTMPELFRVIFSLDDFTVPTDNRLRKATIHPDPKPWDAEVFVDKEGDITWYPKSLVVQFDAKVMEDERHAFRPHRDLSLNFMMGRRVLVMLFVVTLISPIFILGRYLLERTPAHDTPQYAPPYTAQLGVECNEPTVTIEPWHVRTFRPAFFGMYGEPEPIIYRTNSDRTMRISVLDIDKRDIEVRLWVDHQNRGYRTALLDPTVDCGEDVEECIRLHFAFFSVVVPPGKHAVKAEIVKRNKTFDWGEERERRVMLTAERCS